MKHPKTSSGKIIKLVLAIFLLAGIYYYIALPAFNFHSEGLWKFIIFLAILFVLFMAREDLGNLANARTPGSLQYALKDLLKSSKIKLGLIIFFVIAIIYFIGTVLSSPVVNAEKYQKLIKVEKGEFAEEIAQISYNQIPLLDRESAEILGDRKMGSLVDLASQFEVGDLYNQINLADRPVRVTPLQYADLIKWFTNRKNGISAYIKIDMATQNTELVRLKEGMKYTIYDHFGRNLYRHLRFQYPTYIFDDISFEINEDGTPYWVCSVAKFNIGLFGGRTIGHVVLCNAITGECKDYPVDQVPEWVDRVYSAEMLTTLYNYYGTLKHGYFNSVLSQKDCFSTTNGYNYLILNDDVWVYTGVTSITSDQSNVGFVLMNQRTMETRYYEIEGAIEDSAMSSAEGKVQNLGYQATFPLLLNINGQPTYFMSLKDASGLVKKYAMVNVQNYQVVATGDSVSECEKAFRKLMKENGLKVSSASSVNAEQTITGHIKKIADVVIDGNSHYYILLEESASLYDVLVADHLKIVTYETGDSITLSYEESDNDTKTVTNIP